MLSTQPRILLFEHRDASRVSGASLLKLSGLEVDVAGSIASAKKLLEKNDYDLLVVDHGFIETNRSELPIGKLAVKSDVPVIVISQFPSLEAALTKIDAVPGNEPFQPEEIDRILARIYDELGDPNRSSVSVAVRKRRDELARTPVRVLANNRSHLHLTLREVDVVRELLDGYRVSTVARRLSISTNTVRRHLKRIFLKLEVSSQAELLEKLRS